MQTNETFRYVPGARRVGNQFRACVKVTRNGKLIGSKYGKRPLMTQGLALSFALHAAQIAARKTGALVTIPANVRPFPAMVQQ